MKDIKDLREEIDRIDREIARLYEERMLLMDEVALYKKKKNLPVFDSEREQIVIEKNCNYIENKNLEPYYKEMIQFIMDQGKAIQNKLID